MTVRGGGGELPTGLFLLEGLLTCGVGMVIGGACLIGRIAGGLFFPGGFGFFSVGWPIKVG